ncbi:MAG: ABC transporter ATP-binding protein [Myxococcales bacterium]|nr:ABC transporter ATP-binding protein [Myxococcales bacterium]
MTDPTQPLLQVRGLMKDYGGRRVVDDVSFDVSAGEAVALVGESGSGKSTIAKLLSRLVEPDGGEIKLDGVNMLEREPRGPSLAYRSQLQMIFQDPFASLNPIHPIRHHLERPLLRHQRVPKEKLEARALELLTMVGLQPAADFLDAYPTELSGGQRQRVAIARALAVEPRVLMADEPTSMLDASVRMGVLGVLQGLVKDSRIALLLITHDLATARLLCDRVIVLFSGRIVEDGPSDTLLTSPSHPYTQALLAALPRGVPRVVKETHPMLPSPAGGGGCPFRSRCPESTSQCKDTMPKLESLSEGRRVRCFNRDTAHV